MKKAKMLVPEGDMVLLRHQKDDSVIKLIDTKDPNTDSPGRWELVSVGEGEHAVKKSHLVGKYVAFALIRPRLRDEIDGVQYALVDAQDIMGRIVYEDENDA